MYSVGVKGSTIETKNRFETLNVSECDTTEETGRSKQERHEFPCCKPEARRAPDITVLVKGEMVKSKVETKANRKQRMKETKE